MPFILGSKNLGKTNVREIGGKGANLAELINAGFPVPPVFFVTTEAFDRFLEENELKQKIKDIIAKIDFSSVDSLKDASDRIKSMILNGRVPSVIHDAILSEYNKMSYSDDSGTDFDNTGKNLPFVAVRSSGTSEDAKGASSAGQYETFLNVRGDKNLMLSVMKCWASVYTPRVIYYRYKNSQSQEASISVVVQRMVNSDRSGVAFTIDPMNPVNGARNIIIEACWGLGETIVQGEVEPDHYVIDKVAGKISTIKIGEKRLMRIRDIYSGTTIKRDVPAEKIKQQVLSESEIMTLSAYCKKIENHYKYPQDIEWASERGKLYILQTRSVTTLEEKRTQAVIGTPILIGTGASPGYAWGTVKLVKNISELGKVQKGDILVTKMTNPDMVTAMEKAAAIVTDQGGSTCFSGDTKILTNKGFFTMEQIYDLKDENLLTVSVNRETLKTEWKKIKNTMRRKAAVWELSVSQTGHSKRNRLKVTPDHKMLTFDKRKIVERKLDDMIENNEFVCTVDKISPLLNNDGGDGRELAYLAGSIFSDGNISLSNRHGRVTFTQKETELKKDFIKAVQSSFDHVFSYKLNFTKTKKTEGIIRGKKIIGSANDYVCCRKMPAMILSEMRENISRIALTVPDEVLLSYMAGLIDGDGTRGSSKTGRLHIFSGKDDIVKSIIISCLRLGISPQVSLNRDNCYNIQFVERLDKIIENTKRVKCQISKRKIGTKMFAAKQIFSDIVDNVNYLGRIKPYVQNNLMIDADKIRYKLLSMAPEKERLELAKIIDSDLRMQRIIKLNDLEEQDVYNIEVEDNHNYVVFTEMYTPVLVNNCHAAIVSRELGVPCVVGTRRATELLHDGSIVTVDATHGKVFEGKIEIEIHKEAVHNIKTKTLVKVNLAFPETAEKGVRADGVGLLRLEHMLTKHGYHPIEYIRQEKQQELIDIIIDGVGRVARAFYPKPVWIRTLDVRTDEYRNMIGGENEIKEDNPMLGWHGIRRSLDTTEILKCEFTALKDLYEKGLDNIGVMIPFSCDVGELVATKKFAKEFGLPDKIKFGVMVEVPSCALSIEDYCKVGIDFISFGSNDLTQLTMGLDRNNEKLNKLFDEMHTSMKLLFAHVIETCKKHNVETSICGEAPSNRREIVEYLVKLGITSLSVNIDAIEKVREWVSEIERKQ